jgi:hypothetical protein
VEHLESNSNLTLKMEDENMKKVFAFCVALSFVLSACGDDSSSTAPVTVGAESSPAMGVSSSSGEPASSGVVEESSSSANVCLV